MSWLFKKQTPMPKKVETETMGEKPMPSQQDGNLEGLPMFGPQKPQTREELDTYINSVRDGLPNRGEGTPIVPLHKTSRKYEGLKKNTCMGEKPEGESVAVEGMFDLIRENQDTVTKPGCKNHYETQRLDQEFHRGVTSREDNPYGPGTSFLTNWAPLWGRSLYSGISSYIPEFTGSGFTEPVKKRD